MSGALLLALVARVVEAPCGEHPAWFCCRVGTAGAALPPPAVRI